MDLDLVLLRGFYLFSIFVMGAFFFQRLRWRRRKRLGKRCLGFYPGAASMGNALHKLQVLAQPQVQYVLEEKLEEESDDDEEGAPKDPTEHLHRQAAKIRRGVKVERLTALLKKTDRDLSN